MGNSKSQPSASSQSSVVTSSFSTFSTTTYTSAINSRSAISQASTQPRNVYHSTTAVKSNVTSAPSNASRILTQPASRILIKPAPKQAACHPIFSANNYVIPNNVVVDYEFIPNICVPFRSRVDRFPMRVCPQYNSFKGCKFIPCHRFHICQFWVKGDCKRNDCPYAHSLNDSHNFTLLQPHVRRNFGEEQILDVLKRGSFVGKSYSNVQIGSYICLGYIHKKCTRSNCNSHHFTSPFIWEISIGDGWERFMPQQNNELEKSYCDPKNITFVLSKLLQLNYKSKPSLLYQALGDSCCTVNFENLSLKSSYSFFRIRRLSTPSDILYSHSSATRWLWHWQDISDMWKIYLCGTINNYFVIPLSDHLEYLFLKNTKEINVTINDTTYLLNFQTMTQVNTSTGNVHLVRRRPMYHTVHEKLNPNATFRNIWTKTTDASIKYVRVSVNPGSSEFSFVSNMLMQTLPSISDINVQRIENPFLWESYQLKKKQYLEKYERNIDQVNEQYLFHGTNYSVVDKICSDGFDWRLFGTSVGYVYGQGTYFSNEASLSNRYSFVNDDGYKSMFIVLVLVGTSTVGDQSMTIPPKNILNNKRFDTTVNDYSSPFIFVKYDLDEYYPAYYIQYKE